MHRPLCAPPPKSTGPGVRVRRGLGRIGRRGIRAPGSVERAHWALMAPRVVGRRQPVLLLARMSDTTGGQPDGRPARGLQPRKHPPAISAEGTQPARAKPMEFCFARARRPGGVWARGLLGSGGAHHRRHTRCGPAAKPHPAERQCANHPLQSGEMSVRRRMRCHFLPNKPSPPATLWCFGESCGGRTPVQRGVGMARHIRCLGSP